jgi:hypothetical protein
LFFVFVLFIISLIFSPRFLDDDIDIMIPYDLFYSILHKYGLLLGTGLGGSVCPFLGYLGMSCSETWWFLDHFEVKKGEICYFLAIGSPGLGQFKPP